MCQVFCCYREPEPPPGAGSICPPVDGGIRGPDEYPLGCDVLAVFRQPAKLNSTAAANIAILNFLPMFDSFPL